MPKQRPLVSVFEAIAGSLFPKQVSRHRFNAVKD
jgi:hypothetical protein